MNAFVQEKLAQDVGGTGTNVLTSNATPGNAVLAFIVPTQTTLDSLVSAMGTFEPVNAKPTVRDISIAPGAGQWWVCHHVTTASAAMQAFSGGSAVPFSAYTVEFSGGPFYTAKLRALDGNGNSASVTVTDLVVGYPAAVAVMVEPADAIGSLNSPWTAIGSTLGDGFIEVSGAHLIAPATTESATWALGNTIPPNDWGIAVAYLLPEPRGSMLTLF